MSVIILDDVWERYRIPHIKRTTVLEQIGATLSLLGGNPYRYEEFWALKSIGLEIRRGESLGVIGPNGSGKSTLLKLMAGVMKPDKGHISAVGSIAPVLELGIGFHPDLRVKENAMIYGVIMGLARSEMRKRIGPIVDFAGLYRFQDTDLKHLSSGLQVRLAFFIAVQTDANILLVDEALAVGDLEFQEKCLDKFREFKKLRKTIVLVSHNMGLVNSFCEKTLYLQKGEKRVLGPSEESTGLYVRDIQDRAGQL